MIYRFSRILGSILIIAGVGYTSEPFDSLVSEYFQYQRAHTLGIPGVPDSIITNSFDITFPISDSCYIFLQGHRLTETVRCTWKRGGVMLVNGIQAWPDPRPHPLPENTEAQIREKYEPIPFIRAGVKNGLSWREAYAEWNGLRSDIKNQVMKAYRSVIACADETEARRAAGEIFDFLAWGTIGSRNRLLWKDGNLYFPWAGMDRMSDSFPEDMLRHETNIVPCMRSCSDSPPPDTEGIRVKSILKSIWSSSRSMNRYTIAVMPSAGGLIRERTLTKASFEKRYLSQIRDSRPDSLLPGLIGGRFLKEILERGGLQD